MFTEKCIWKVSFKSTVWDERQTTFRSFFIKVLCKVFSFLFLLLGIIFLISFKNYKGKTMFKKIALLAEFNYSCSRSKKSEYIYYSIYFLNIQINYKKYPLFLYSICIYRWEERTKTSKSFNIRFWVDLQVLRYPEQDMVTLRKYLSVLCVTINFVVSRTNIYLLWNFKFSNNFV